MKKILVTLGPSSLNEKTVKKISKIGVDLFRINLSHTKLSDVEKNINLIKSWTKTPICLDSEGAQLRNGSMETEKVIFDKNDKVKIFFEPIKGDKNKISFNPISATKQFSIGDQIQVDFNHVRFQIIEKKDKYFNSIVIEPGSIGSNKAADINKDIEFDPLTEKDREAIKIGLKNGIQNFAMSFTNHPEDVKLMKRLCGERANIICKIESPSGVKNLGQILDITDCILIDRGDLSRRIAIEKIPFLQRKIISAAKKINKPVFVATNLLETMITTQSPTRAEVNDVVSTLEMGGDGLVLAAETAIGKFPVQSVQMIRKLINIYDQWTPNTSIKDLIEN